MPSRKKAKKNLALPILPIRSYGFYSKVDYTSIGFYPND